MAEGSDTSAAGHRADQRLDSWKAIAAYLGRDVTTVQRWERREGLPVHRHVHDKLGSVYAFRVEIDDWLRQRTHHRSGTADATPTASEGQLANADGPAPPLTSGGGLPPAATARPPRLALALGLAASVVALATAAWWITARRDVGPLDPLAGARYQVVTDFEGTEQAAAISRDGSLVAFVSDRDGHPDVWVTRVGTSQVYNLTQGRVRELVNPDVRTLGFSPDGAQVTFWARGVQGAATDAIGIWAVPTLGGAPRPYLEGVAEYEWDPPAERLVAHAPSSGDPTFIQRGPNQPRAPVFTAPDGRHAHFPTWSADGQRLYMVLGTVPDALDIYRIDADGTDLQRLTHHAARVTYPVFLDARTLLYLVSDDGHTGGVLHVLDVETLASQSLVRGLERYHSLSASADGRRIVATLADTKRTLWRVPDIERAEASTTRVTPILLPTASGWAPRHGPSSLFYVTGKGAGHALWKLVDGHAGEVWSAGDARVLGGPAVTMDGRRVAITIEQERRTRILVMNTDGTSSRVVGDGLDLRGEPSWALDGSSLTSGVVMNGKPSIVRLPLDGPPVPIVAEFGLNPVWSPDGRMVVYSGPDVGTQFTLAAASASGAPAPLPRITLPRGARRIRFLPSGDALVVMRGDFRHKELFLIDLATGVERALTALPAAFLIRDYDLSDDGRALVLERVQEHSDIVLIDRAR